MKLRSTLAIALGLSVLGVVIWVLPTATTAGVGRAASGRLVASAVRTPTGEVRLSWKLEGATRPTRWRVLRAIDPALLDRADDQTHPVARWDLPPSAATTWTDPGPADGVTYAYRVEATTAAGTLESSAVTVTIPPRALPPLTAPAIAIDKRAYVLTVTDGDRVAKRYPIALGGAPTRRKHQFDNASTPEGLYTVVNLQPRATYHRAYDLSYPNALDRVRHTVLQSGRPIGGEIQIHGKGIDSNWTFGCIALRDTDMDELFTRPALRAGVPVRIWGGELTEADVNAMETIPPAATLKAWTRALGAKGHPSDGRWGPSLWMAIGKFQRAEGLEATCQPDAATARRLGLPIPVR